VKAHSAQQTPTRLTILIPVYNDWTVAALLLAELDRTFAKTDTRPRVLLINDGSSQPVPSPFITWRPTSLERIDVLELYRNLGHQRALCVGMVHVYLENAADAVLIMDADGEDDPREVPSLLKRFMEEDQRKMVFAARGRRMEGFVFKLFYQIYRTIHRVFVGLDIRIGNYSVLPFSALETLVRSGHLWNHYAAAAIKSKLGLETISIDRAKRLQGHSSMGFVGLLIHGLSAMSVYSDIIGARLLLLLGILFTGGVGALGAVALFGLVAPYHVPAWVPVASGLLLLLLFQILMLALLFTFGVLATRATPEFIPLRQCPEFIKRVTRVDVSEG
jgi:hypothetical protein